MTQNYFEYTLKDLQAFAAANEALLSEQDRKEADRCAFEMLQAGAAFDEIREALRDAFLNGVLYCKKLAR